MIFVCVKNGAEQGLTCASLGSLLAPAAGIRPLRDRRISLRLTWRKSHE